MGHVLVVDIIPQRSIGRVPSTRMFIPHKVLGRAPSNRMFIPHKILGRAPSIRMFIPRLDPSRLMALPWGKREEKQQD